MSEAPLTPQEKAHAIREAWEKGRLYYKLHAHQKRAYERIWQQFSAKRRRRMLLRWSRRIGKTFTSQVIVVENCIRLPGSRYVVAAPSEKHLEKFVHPTIEAICADAPPGYVPHFDRAASEYKFPNGSVISLHGCDTDAKIALMSRGPFAHGVVFEEAGQIPNLRKAVKATSPQLLSNRKLPFSGWMLFVGTPPEGTGHEFVEISRYYAQEGREIHYTIFDGHYSQEELDAFLDEDADGMPIEEYRASEDYRREWLGELIGDPARMVLKFATEANLKACVERYRALGGRRPSHYVVYEGMDVGWDDWTVWLLGWWHHRERMLVIEREEVYRDGFKRDALARDVKRAEEAFLGDTRRSPFQRGTAAPRRWSDYAPEMLSELAAEHDLLFAHTRKDDRDTAINECDRMIAGYGRVGKLAINPACRVLLAQMPAAIWNKQRTEFARNATKRHGHYDAVAALVYMSRNVMRDEDPVPPGFGVGGPGSYVIDDAPRAPTSAAEKLAKLWGLEVTEE